MRTGLAAAALIICISMGYMACSRMRDRVDKLNALCAEIRTLGDSMELSQYRLSEMLDRLGGELWREYAAALTWEQLGAGEAWAATVQKEADGGSLSGLDKQDIAALITLGEAFSSISRAAQADHARLTLRQMEARAADAEKALMGKGKLYSTLGVLARDMSIAVVFKIAGIGILVAIICQLLKQTGRDDMAMLAALSGLVLTLSMVADLIGDLFENVRRIFELY